MAKSTTPARVRKVKDTPHVRDLAAVRVALVGVWDHMETEARRLKELLEGYANDSRFWFVGTPLSELDGILDCLKHGRPAAPSRTFAELESALKAS